MLFPRNELIPNDHISSKVLLIAFAFCFLQNKNVCFQFSEEHRYDINLLDLPITILEHIFSFLPGREWFKTIRLVNKSFEEIVFQNLTVASIKDSEISADMFSKFKKLQDLSVVFEKQSLSSSGLLGIIQKLSSLQSLRLVCYQFKESDLTDLCSVLQSMNIKCLNVECSIQSIKPQTFEYILETLPSLKSVSLPLCSGYDNQLKAVIERFTPNVSFGHQVLDVVKPDILSKYRSAYLQH